MFKKLSVEERELKCYDYFHTNCITNREQLRESLKKLPIAGVNSRFAEEMLSDFLENQRELLKRQEDISFNKGEGRKTIFVLNDLHIPYHDEKTVELVFDCIIDNQPDYIVLNGDILDFYGCSKFQKRPDRLLMLQDEIDIFYRLFRNLRKHIPNTEVHYVLGNHENRITSIMMDNPGLFNLKALSPDSLLMLDKLDFIGHKTKFKINDFIFFHGDVVRQDSSFSAKQEFIDHKMQNGISAHTHRLGVYYKTYDTNVTYWYENGCLCTLEPDYLKDPTKANWQQGFAVMNMYDGITQVNQVLIQNHKFVYNGKLYK